MTDPRAAAQKFADELIGALEGRLRSILLYGSVPRGEAVPGVSDINILVLVDEVDGAALRAAGPLARRWAEAGNTAPLLMPWGEWQRAADAFGVELADMRDAHEVLHGEDPLAGLAVEYAALRLQTERELRGKLIQLREGMLLAAEYPEQVGRLLQAALPSFVAYFRAALRLAGGEAPVDSERAMQRAGELMDADADAVLRVWRARADRDELSVEVDDSLAAGYYELGERTATYVDALPQNGSVA